MNVISILLSAFGIIGVAGGAAGYFKASLGNSVIKGQAELINTRDLKLADQDKMIVALQSENKVLVEQNQTLKALAQGAPQLKKLTTSIEKLIKAIAK